MRIAHVLRLRVAGWMAVAGIAAAASAADGGAKDAPSPFPQTVNTNLTMAYRPLPDLPVRRLGAFVGVVKGVLIVAGGAEDAAGGGRIVSPEIYWIDTAVTNAPSWRKAPSGLPEAVAFGASAVAEGRLLCLGGRTDFGDSKRVVQIVPEPRDGTVRVVEAAEEFPPLPEALSFASARAMDGSLYLVGGCRSDSGAEADLRPVPGGRAYALELTQKDPKTGQRPTRRWTPVSFVNPDGSTANPFPRGAAFPLLDVRKDERAYKNALLVFGGWQSATGTASSVEFRRECWRFVPGRKSRNGWIRMADLPEGFQAFSSAPLGPAHLLVHTSAGRPAPRRAADLGRAAAGRSLSMYQTYTGTWVENVRAETPLTGVLAATESGIVWCGTGSHAAAGTLAPVYSAKRFGWIDFTVIALYMLGMIGIGEFFRRRERNSTDYFLGSRKIPWWAAGISIWATGVSAISYMAIPAKTYAFDWSYISLGIWPVLTTYVAAYAFIPLLRRLEIVSITEYVEMRFGRSIRIPITVITIVGGVLGRLSTVLLLPSLALSAVTGWKVWISIVSMGVITTIYTVAGGMSAVVWTDVAQAVVMFGGVILSFVLVVVNVDGGMAGVVQTALDNEKLRMFDFAWDFSVATFWVFILWAVIDLWGKIGQEGLQRAFSTKDVRTARKSMITCAWISVPGTLLFYGIGTALFAFYKQHPNRLAPNLPTDGIFPLFIMQQLPTGIAGLVIAGIFAAAMSTLSGMNSSATIVVQDFCAYFAPKARDERKLAAARWVTLLYGAMATAGAWYMSTWKISSIWDTFSKVMSLIGGGLGCIMVLALLSRRANTLGVWVGIVCGTAALWSIELFFSQHVSFFIYGTVATAVACLTGYVASVLSGGSTKNLHGLTLWTLDRSAETPEGAARRS